MASLLYQSGLISVQCSWPELPHNLILFVPAYVCQRRVDLYLQRVCNTLQRNLTVSAWYATQVEAGEPLQRAADASIGTDATQLAAPSFQALITAWDHLAQRLPKQAGTENAAGIILNALKLVFALSNAENAQRDPDGSAATAPASARMLALALQLADLAAQVTSLPTTSSLPAFLAVLQILASLLVLRSCPCICTSHHIA